MQLILRTYILNPSEIWSNLLSLFDFGYSQKHPMAEGWASTGYADWEMTTYRFLRGAVSPAGCAGFRGNSSSC